MALTAEQLWADLEACLFGSLVNDEATRHQAESRMAQLETMEEYAVVLVRGCVHTGIKPQTRQLACMALKKFIKEHWSSDDDTFKGPECSAEVKQLVRASLPTGLSDHDKSVRTAVAYTTSKIASHDWPEHWPTLVPAILTTLNSGVTGSELGPACDGAVRVLDELVNDFDAVYLPQLIEALLPSLFALLSLPVTKDQHIHAMTVDILSTIFDLAGATEQYHLVTAAIEQITPLLAQFITPTTPPMYTYKLRRAAISCAGRLAIQHAKTCSALLLNTLLPAVCQAMEEASAVYVKAVVLGEGEETDTSGDDGECGSTELLCAGIEVLVNVTCVPTYKKFLKTNQGNLSYLVLGCMQMTEEQHDTWGDDVNAFLADDSEESMSNTVRNLCIGLISAMMEALPRSTIVSLFTSTSKRLQESQAMRMAPGGSNDKLWWRIAEGALLGLGSVGNIIQDENLHKSMASVDINAIVQSVFAESLTQNNVPYLIGRTLWFAGQFSFALNAGTHTLVVSHSATALGGDFPMPVRILALRTAKSVCEDSGKHTDTLKQTLLPALYATLPALLPVATEELLLLVLDLLALAIPIDAQLAAKYEDKLCPMVVAVWIKFANDPVLCTYISDVYLSLSQTPCLPNLIRRSLSPIVSVLSMAEGQVLPGMQASAVDFLTTNVRACSTPIPDVLVSTALPALMSFLNRTEDGEAIQNGCDCLVMYLSHAHAQLIAANAIEPIVAFVARVLSMPSDSAGTLVGRLIIKLVKKVDLGEYMLPMLNTALQKLSSVSFILYEQTLVVMFAQMMLADLSWCLGFLTSQTVDVVSGNTPYLSPVGVNHKGETVTRTVSGFELVMAKWVESQQMFSGRFDVNTALVALSQLCSSTDPAVQKLLNETIVKGERVVSAEEMKTIRTRSRAKTMSETYTTVSLADKIVIVLAKELLHRQYEQEQGSDGWEEDGSGDEDDGEDGWEDAPSGKNSSPFAPASDYTNLSDALFSGGLMDDVDDQVVEDPEILKDPLFKLDIKAHLVSTFQNLAQANAQALQSSLGNTMKPEELETLRKILQ